MRIIVDMNNNTLRSIVKYRAMIMTSLRGQSFVKMPRLGLRVIGELAQRAVDCYFIILLI